MGTTESCCSDKDEKKAVATIEIVSTWPVTGETEGEAEEGASPVEIQDRCYKMRKLQHLDVDEDILRAIPLKKSLRGLGHLWRKSPIDLTKDEGEGLWAQSQPVDYIDTFLSHTWSTPGGHKVLSLTIQSAWLFILLSWASVALIFSVLCILDFLPMPFSIHVTVLEFQAQCKVGVWVVISSLLAAVLSAFLWPWVPEVLCLKSNKCFLDVVCIHQTDADLKERGIYGLGGFLKVSRELRVLWTGPYLSRLWCVFELAAYHSANPRGQTNLTSVPIELGVFVAMIGSYVASICFAFAYAIPTASDSLSSGSSLAPNVRFFLALFFGMLPIVFVIHSLRNIFQKHAQMLEGLEHFDAEQASCRSDFDREFIFTGIKAWFGSTMNFNHYVRTTLRRSLLRKRNPFPARYSSLIVVGPVSLGLETFLGMCKEGAPFKCILTYIGCQLVCANVMWIMLSIRLLALLAEHFFSRSSSRFRDYAKSLCIWAVFYIFLYVGLLAGAEARKVNEMAALIWVLIALLLFGLAVRRDLL
ncbi:unnamed protein product [Effrenium voratum]|uniref:Uncharacterized protein n=1 Tax=Effrenium voratum TaxID=2562239 RepID=A0AA36MZB3_9DINO|nr:unnamed protein product [Effrenium voratum]